MYQAALSHELVTQTDGTTRLNLWISEYDGFNDDGLFLIKDKTNMVDETPKYASVCNPANLVEYPYARPEGPRGYMRGGHASILYSSDADAMASLQRIAVRVDALVERMNHITNPDNHVTSSTVLGDRTLEIVRSKPLSKFVYLKLTADIPCFLIVESDTMGTLSKGVCTPAEMKTIGTMVGADNGWRVPSVEMIIYANLYSDILEDSMDRLRLL